MDKHIKKDLVKLRHKISTKNRLLDKIPMKLYIQLITSK